MVLAVEREAVLREVLVVEPSEDGCLGVIGSDVQNLYAGTSVYGAKCTRSSAARAFFSTRFVAVLMMS